MPAPVNFNRYLKESGAILVGGISFSAGFFGPMLLAPSANQEPLPGIFITGPIGVILGAIGG